MYLGGTDVVLVQSKDQLDPACARLTLYILKPGCPACIARAIGVGNPTRKHHTRLEGGTRRGDGRAGWGGGWDGGWDGGGGARYSPEGRARCLRMSAGCSTAQDDEAGGGSQPPSHHVPAFPRYAHPAAHTATDDQPGTTR